MTALAPPRLDAPVTDLPTRRQPRSADDGTDGLRRTVFIDREHPRAARNARHAAAATGWDWRLPQTAIDDLVDIVDALVVNAIIHAKWTDDWPAVPVVIAMAGPRVAVEVRDPDPTLPVWPTARPLDIAALIDDPDIGPDALVLIHRQGLVDVAGRAELSAHVEGVGKVVRAQFRIGGVR